MIKGNQVKILNRPAAVSFAKVSNDTQATVSKIGMGRMFGDEVSQKTCQNYNPYLAFVE